jgi:hypothetical protein
MGGGSFFAQSGTLVLKRADPTMVGLMMGAMVAQPKIILEKEDVTQSLRCYDQNNFGHNIIDIE